MNITKEQAFNMYGHVRLLPKQLSIFDLDGCVSDDKWRLNLIRRSGRDRFDQYHLKCADDQVITCGVEQLEYSINEGHGIIFITGRPEFAREDTVKWIRNRIGLKSFCLFMRQPCEEGVGTVTIKNRVVGNIMLCLDEHQHLVAAYDDREDIVHMYRECGIDAKILDRDGLRDLLPGKYHDKWSATSDGGRAADILTDTFVEPRPADILMGMSTTPRPASKDAERTAADILEEAGKTFRERNAVYKDNADNVGKVMAALFPNGVQIKTAADHKMYHLFELIVVKMTRFANSGLTHEDSIHDMAVYAAMCENLSKTHNIQFK